MMNFGNSPLLDMGTSQQQPPTMDADTIFSDLMQMLENMSNYEFDLGFIKGRIDGGAITIDLPDNIVTTILFGSKKSISFAKEDFEELKNLLTAES